MSGRALLLLSLATPSFALDVVRTVQMGRPLTPNAVMPVVSRGYVLYMEISSPVLSVYRPSGEPAFTVDLKSPFALPPQVEDAAVDDRGRVAVALALPDNSGSAEGGIAVLDPSGVQKSLIRTGRYMPTHLTFDGAGAIWTDGWQRDAVKVHTEDSEDYAVIRRFDSAGNQTGAFVKRSSFPRPGLSPDCAIHGWGMRAAGERVGAWLCSGQTSERRLWLELDRDGQELGRWTLPKNHNNGMAFTGEDLYTVLSSSDQERRRSVWMLSKLDRATAEWTTIAAGELSWDDAQSKGFGILMDADGENLVFVRGGSVLEWVKP
jgi:hypothetical protein